MKVLYVTGACLTRNTSANMSHNGFVKGLLDCGSEVDIVIAKDSWGEVDKALPRWGKANYFEFDSVSLTDKLRKYVRKSVDGRNDSSVVSSGMDSNPTYTNKRNKYKAIIRKILKNIFYVINKPDPVYPLEKKWLKTSQKFKSEVVYDLVVSNSSPAASHKLVTLLRDKKKIKYRRWVQIWEDPWFFDLYGGHSEKIREEEHWLLQQASEIYYVSPLTLKYQKEYYSDCASKMKCVPLPFFEFEKKEKVEAEVNEIAFGYFGDYFSKTRNLVPFYNALKKSGYKGYIYGDSDVKLDETEDIIVAGRVTLDKLAIVQNKTGVLVHLCNLQGGQIPGKIYHYSATNKPILFVLDGTEEEKKAIYDFFSKYNRYQFCENNINDIRAAIKEILEKKNQISAKPVEAFEPQNVVKMILNEESI